MVTSDTSGGRRRTRESPDVRRASILEAAERVVLERGTGGVTMDAVAEGAGVAKGTVYLYFDSKDDLLEALRERFADVYLEPVWVALTPGGRGSRARRLAAAIEGLFRASAEGETLFHALFHEPDASEAALMDAGRDALVAFVADGVEAGEFTVPDVAVAAEFLLHALHGAVSAASHSIGPPRRVVVATQQLSRRTLGA